MLTVVYVFQRSSVSSRVIWVAGPPLHDHLHGVEVISLNIEVRYPAVALRGFHIAVSEQILDGGKIRIGVEKLCGHRMAEMMAGNSQLRFPGIVFHALLYAADGDGLSQARSLFHQKDSFRSGGRPRFQISDQRLKAVVTQIN